MGLDVAKQQAKLGTPTAKQSCQLPAKASFMVIRAHTHTRAHRSARPHSWRLVLQTHAHTCWRAFSRTHASCQERCLEREDLCHLLSHPASLFWLPNCQSPLSTTSHTEKQMSACHFLRRLTPLFFFFFFFIHRWRWREPHLSVTYVYYGVSHSSLYFRVKARVKQLKLDMIIAILCHFLVPGYDFPALFLPSWNTLQGQFTAVAFQQSPGEIVGNVPQSAHDAALGVQKLLNCQVMYVASHIIYGRNSVLSWAIVFVVLLEKNIVPLCVGKGWQE